MADSDGWTAIMYASIRGHEEVVRTLLAVPGIDVGKEVTSGLH